MVRISAFVVVVLLVISGGVYFWMAQQESERLRVETERKNAQIAQEKAEAERQSKVALKAYNAIERFIQSPNLLTDHDASVALDSLSEEHVNRDKISSLKAYYYGLKRCALLDEMTRVGGGTAGIKQACSEISENRENARNAAGIGR